MLGAGLEVPRLLRGGCIVNQSWVGGASSNLRESCYLTCTMPTHTVPCVCGLQA